jgi:hypothetical protein
MSPSRPAILQEQPISGEVLRHIGVLPARALADCKKLLAALAEIFPVSFEERAPDDLGRLDGLLVLDPANFGEPPIGIPTLLCSSPHGASAKGELVEFGSNELIKAPLRSRGLVEEAAHGRPPVAFRSGDAVLASVDSEPVWWWRAGARARVHVNAFSVGELGEGETLREHLRSGRFMGLVPLLHFLGELCGELGWSEQPSYGFLEYASLIRHASAHGYHVSFAMVPLDGWLINRRAAALLRANSAFLSLVVHGNDHISRELGRLSSDRDAELVVGQALRRIASFERRSGVAVKRVMVPPHGACSEYALRAMFRLGFDAACISRPYPWRDDLPPFSPLVGWYPAEMVAGGLPVLPRHHLDRPREELVFRALLRQPLILYGHHWDLARGLDAFAQAAEDVNALGEVSWGPLDWIASRNYSTRREGEVLGVQMYSRRALVDVPEGVSALRVHTKLAHGEPLWREIAYGSSRAPMMRAGGGWTSQPLHVSHGAEVELSLTAEHPLDADVLSHLTAKPWPIARRVLVEGRDRARPLIGRLHPSERASSRV